MLLHGGAIGGAIGELGQGQVGDVGGIGLPAMARVEGMLETGAEQDPLVTLKDVLGAVAVVDIKVDDRDPFQAMFSHGMGGTDGDVVEEAKAHGTFALGMVPGRTHAAEGGMVLVAHHQVDAHHRGPGGTQGGGEGAPAHGGITIDPGELAIDGRGGAEDEIDVLRIVDPQQLLPGDLGGVVVGDQHLHAGGDHAVGDGEQPLRALRVVGARLVVLAQVMANKSEVHGVKVSPHCAVVSAGPGWTGPREGENGCCPYLVITARQDIGYIGGPSRGPPRRVRPGQ